MDNVYSFDLLIRDSEGGWIYYEFPWLVFSAFGKHTSFPPAWLFKVGLFNEF